MPSDFTVYCDESRHSFGPDAQFKVIGGLWVRTEARDALSRKIRDLKSDLKANSELKWSKVSALKLSAYTAISQIMFDFPDTYFRAIIVDQSKVDYERFHKGDVELGFYKFYYEMLEKWLLPRTSYTILVDFKQNQERGRLVKLRECLSRYGAKNGTSIRDLTSIDSSQSNVAQLCDIMTGAVAGDANGLRYGSPKQSLAHSLARMRNAYPLSSPSRSPSMSKFNVFRIALGD